MKRWSISLPRLLLLTIAIVCLARAGVGAAANEDGLPAFDRAVSDAPCSNSSGDCTPPVLVSLDFSPKIIDTSSAPATVTMTIHVTDETGVSSIEVYFNGPAPLAYTQGSWSEGPYQQSGSRISGTAQDGIYVIPVVFQRYSAHGLWNLSISLTDRANNRAFFPGFLLAQPTDVQQIGSGDNLAPRVDGITFEPQEIDASQGPAQVTVSLHLTDDLSGVRSDGISAFFRSERFVTNACLTGLYTSSCYIYGFAWKLVSGTANDGVYQATLTLVQGADLGLWRLSALFLIDMVGNYVSYNDVAGPPPPNATFRVASQPAPTTTPVATPTPTLTATPDVPSGPATLAVTAARGTTILKVTTTAGFRVGDVIVINPGGANQEPAIVAGFGSIILATPLRFDHLAGEAVVEASPAQLAGIGGRAPVANNGGAIASILRPIGASNRATPAVAAGVDSATLPPHISPPSTGNAGLPRR